MPLRPLFTINNSIIDSVKSNEVFDDVLPQFEPKGLLQVSYGQDKDVTLGNTLTVEETQIKPHFQFLANINNDGEQVVKESDLFTLVLTDPDAPSRTDKKWSEYAHFITTNIKLQNSLDGDLFTSELDLGTQGNEVLKYQGPGPPPGTGKHRYVFILYKQLSEEPSTLKDRPNWGYGIPATGALRYSQENKLEPWAINFFYAEHKS
jgi:phosphatidylethanolamine-binding protein (PEBP) family uncharacterized protein